MKWFLTIILTFSLYFLNAQPTDQEILETLTEVESILEVHGKTISNYTKFIPDECEFPITTKYDILECYRWGYNRFKLIYQIGDWYVQITFKKDSVGYLVVM